jgi:hypothetical protein
MYAIKEGGFQINISREELKMMLDRMAANLNLDIEEAVALNDGRFHAARTVLIRMGLNPSDEVCADLLAPVKNSGVQRMLMGQKLSIRAAAVKKKNGPARKVWTGFDLD